MITDYMFKFLIRLENLIRCAKLLFFSFVDSKVTFSEATVAPNMSNKGKVLNRLVGDCDYTRWMFLTPLFSSSHIRIIDYQFKIFTKWIVSYWKSFCV